MKFLKLTILVAGLIGLVLSPAMADALHGTKEEAKAMCERAAAAFKADPTAAIAKFQAKDPAFFEKDLYVFVNDKDGKFTSHGAKPALIGKDGLSMKDITGFAFVKAFLEIKESGWVDYKWPDAADNNKIKDKSSYIIRVGDSIVGVGAYKN